MSRRVISIIFYVIAGFFLYIFSMISFIKMDTAYMTSVGMGIFSIPAGITMTVAAILGRPGKRRSEIGITFLSVALFMIFGLITILCLYFSPEFHRMFPDNDFKQSTNLVTGVMTILAVLLTGIVLIGWEKRTRSCSDSETGREGKVDGALLVLALALALFLTSLHNTYAEDIAKCEEIKDLRAQRFCYEQAYTALDAKFRTAEDKLRESLRRVKDDKALAALEQVEKNFRVYRQDACESGRPGGMSFKCGIAVTDLRLKQINEQIKLVAP